MNEYELQISYDRNTTMNGYNILYYPYPKELKKDNEISTQKGDKAQTL